MPTWLLHLLSVADVTDDGAHCGREWGAAQKLCRRQAEPLLWVCQRRRGDMIRTSVVAACFACLGVTTALAQAAPAAPACVYESRSYSDGALICVYRNLMLSCSQDAGKASWKPVTDAALAGVCAASSAPPRPRV